MTMTPVEKKCYEEDRAKRKRAEAENVARRNRESYNDAYERYLGALYEEQE